MREQVFVRAPEGRGGKGRTTEPARKRGDNRAQPTRMPQLRHQVCRVPQLGTAWLPPGLSRVPRRAVDLIGKYSWRDSSLWQDTEAAPAEQASSVRAHSTPKAI